MKAVITVVGKDTVGILATIATECAKYSANIVDVSQTIMQDMFTMVMLVDIANSKIEFTALKDILRNEGKRLGVEITICHEQIFNSMHRI